MAVLIISIAVFMGICILGILLKIRTIGKLKDIEGFGKIMLQDSDEEQIIDEL